MYPINRDALTTTNAILNQPVFTAADVITHAALMRPYIVCGGFTVGKQQKD